MPFTIDYYYLKPISYRLFIIVIAKDPRRHRESPSLRDPLKLLFFLYQLKHPDFAFYSLYASLGRPYFKFSHCFLVFKLPTFFFV